MSSQELQEEEKEVLSSIYDCDECFKQTSDTSFTYRVGDTGDGKSFMVEIAWGEVYPDEVPSISVDGFFNKHLNSASKKQIVDGLSEEAAGLVGTAMTYSLFELAKEKAGDWIVDDPEDGEDSTVSQAPRQDQAKTKEKKQILSKQQKRRLADKCNAQGELPRGWNWVDIVKAEQDWELHFLTQMADHLKAWSSQHSQDITAFQEALQD